MMKNYTFTARDTTGKTYVFEQSDTPYGILLTLKKETLTSCANIYALGEFTQANTDEEGYYVMPRNLPQFADVLTRFEAREDLVYDQTLPIMAFMGVKKKDTCCLIRIARHYGLSFRVSVKGGVYRLEAVLHIEEDYIDPATKLPSEDIEIEVVFLDKNADYNDMARMERKIRLERGEIVPLREKCKHPAVEYARNYPLVRIRQGWKQSPSPIKHQTNENEPPMHVACDFKRVRELADECKRQGIEGAEFQLVGWSIGGHDGRWPQVFPVDERLGGETEYRKTVAYLQTLGYRVSTHTNLQDAYEIADNFSWEDLAQQKDGSPYPIGDFSSGYGYYLCPKFQLENAKAFYPKLAAMGENGVHFTDVMTITFPNPCLNPLHPYTFKQSIDLRLETIRYQKEVFGAFCSEGCVDYALRDLDYGLYLCFGDAYGYIPNPVLSEYVYLWEVAYHGFVLYNPLSSTINYPAKRPEDRLRVIMSGGKPSMYFYSKFRAGEPNWMGDIDFTCDNDEDMRRSVGYIRSALHDYEPLRRLQLVYMERYDVLADGLEMATYADGTRLIGNFSDRVQSYQGREIAPYDYIMCGEEK